jgi:ubiquinone biosynthesis protein Coq4
MPVSTRSPEARIARFLQRVDQIGDVLGINVTPIVELQHLRSLPPATLGRTLADFLEQHNFTPFTTGPRRKQLHDSVHVITGYGTDPIGEVEVQAFLLGTQFHLAQIFLGLGLLRMVYAQSPDRSTSVWQRLIHAYQRGQASTFDLDSWQPERQWQLPIAQVRAIFSIG